jgi:hypothetical protein
LSIYQAPVTSDKPWYRRLLCKGEDRPRTTSPITERDLFVWSDSAKPPLSTLWVFIPLYIVIVAELCSVRQESLDIVLRLYTLQGGMYRNFSHTLSWTIAFDIIIWTFLFPFIIIFVRTIVFILTYLWCQRGFWLFPNIFSDPTFFGPFWPLYAFDTNPKESLGLRWKRFKNSMMAELGLSKRRHKDRMRRISRKTIKSSQRKRNIL